MIYGSVVTLLRHQQPWWLTCISSALSIVEYIDAALMALLLVRRYDKFSFDITDAVEGQAANHKHELLVQVFDPTGKHTSFVRSFVRSFIHSFAHYTCLLPLWSDKLTC